MKKKYKILIIIIMILVLMLAGSYFYVLKNDNLKFKFDYEIYNKVEYNNGKTIKVNIPTNNKIKKIKTNKVMEFLNNGTGILYIGYSTCPWCRRVVPVLIDLVNEYDSIDKIYYLDVYQDLSGIETELYEYLDDYLTEYNEERHLSVPYVFFIKNGKVVYEHLSTVESYKDPFNEMNNEQIEELKSYYKKGIKLMMEG